MDNKPTPDTVNTTEAQAARDQIAATPMLRLPVRCPRCREAGLVGQPPFTTYGYTYRERGDDATQLCDDCGA